MLATGGLLVSIALLTLAVLVPIFNRNDPPRWTTRGWIGEVVTVSIVCAFALGLVYLGAGAIDAFQTGLHYLDLGLLALVLVASIAICRRLKARLRQETAGVRHEHGRLPSGTRAKQRRSRITTSTASEPPAPHKAA